MQLRTFARTLAVGVLAAMVSSAQEPPNGKANAMYGKLPLAFEANQGQTGSEVEFLSRGPGYTAFLTTGGVVLSLRARTVVAASGTLEGSAAATVQFTLVSAARFPVVEGEDPQLGRVNYFFGNDPAKWLTNVPTYAKVRYKNVYPGIDLLYYGNHRQLEYDFELQPGADPNQIRFEVRGARQIELDSEGNLVLRLGNGEIHFQTPIIYQESKGQRMPVDGAYVVTDPNHIAFQVAHYDSSKPLVIDPVLVYSTYLGGSGIDQPAGMAVDSTGSVYVTGYTDSVDFPLATLGTLPTNANHVFVAKLGPAGSNLIYADYIGGNGEDYGVGLVLDAANEVYVTGSTTSGNFPVVKAYQPKEPGPYTGFLTKVSADGSSLLYSTYLGGSTFDQPASIAIDGLGQVHVAGYTASRDFPVVNAYQSMVSANQEGIYGDYGFLTKFSTDGSSLIYSTYLAGNSVVAQACGSGLCWPAPYNTVNALAVDENGDAYVAGTTNTNNFPATPGAFLTTNSTQQDAEIGFVSKFSNAGGLGYSTYFYQSSGMPLGITGIAVDSTGSAYIAGTAVSDGTFPITSTSICDPSVYGLGCSYAFVTKFDPTAATLLYSTFLGPNNYAVPQAIALDATDNAYVLASTSSPSFQTNNAIETSTNKMDVLLVEIDPAATAQLFSTYLGGSGNDAPVGIALDAVDDIYVTGSTNSADFPVTPGAFQGQLGGNTDAFVVKVGAGSKPTISLNPSAVQYPPQLVGSTSRPQQVELRNMSNLPLTISSISVTGDSRETDNCGTSLPPAGNCMLSVTFTPTADGSRSGSVLINATAVGSPQRVSLEGTGFGKPLMGPLMVPPVTVTPSSLTFPATQVGVSSAAQMVTLTNQMSTTALDISSIQITGDYAQTNNCAPVVAAGASCTFSIIFTPAAPGSRTGTLTINDDAPGSPQQLVSLSGIGLGAIAQLTPSSLTFPATQVGVSSAAQTVTLTNQGNAALDISSIQVTGDYAQTNNCAPVVAAGASCTFSIIFTPTAPGSRTGALTISDNAAGSPQTEALSGTGSDFSLASSPASATVKAGATATYTVTVAPVGGAFSTAIQLACSGAPAHSTCSVSPQSATPGSNPSTVTVTVNTTAATVAAMRREPVGQQPAYAIWIEFQGLGILGMALASSKGRKNKTHGLVVLALMATLVLMTACAGGTGIGSQSQPGTPPGTYTITVTGSAGALQHVLRLTLTVQ